MQTADEQEIPDMDTNIAAWMIAGGPRIELRSETRDREQLHAFLEGQRAVERAPGILARIRAGLRPAPVVPAEPACCPA